MKYRRLGRTPMRVSIVGFGASPLGDVYGEVDQASSTETVRRAIDQGINFFDVSPYYGNTIAETRLGIALEGHRSNILLSTKCGRFAVNHFNFSREEIATQFEASLKRLRTDYVDLLQAHDVEFAPIEIIVNEAVPAMREIQRQGKARYIGITGYSLSNLMAIASAVEVDTVLSYCRYNLLADDLESVLMPFAKSHEIGVINACGLHMGVLTERGAPAWHPAPASVHAAGRRIVTACKLRGLDVSEVALSYCLDNPDIACTLVGMSSVSDVEASIRAANTTVDKRVVEEIRKIAKPVHNIRWNSGLEENYG